MSHVVLLKLAIIIEIIGFLLASIFGLILLNKEVLGRRAEKLDGQLTSRINLFNKRFDNRSNPLYVLAHVVSEDAKIPSRMVIEFLIPFFFLILLLCGLFFNLAWLYWIGFVFTVFRLVTLIITAIKMTRSRIEGRFIQVFLFSYVAAVFLTYILEPFVILSVLLIRMTKLCCGLLSTSDTIKRILIIIGTILVGIGLLLELISIW